MAYGVRSRPPALTGGGNLLDRPAHIDGGRQFDAVGLGLFEEVAHELRELLASAAGEVYDREGVELGWSVWWVVLCGVLEIRGNDDDE